MLWKERIYINGKIEIHCGKSRRCLEVTMSGAAARTGVLDEEKKMARKTTASQSNSWSETCRRTASNATKKILNNLF